MWGYKQRLSLTYKKTPQIVGLVMGNGEGRIRTHYLGVAERNVARQLPTSNKGYLSQDPLSFPQGLTHGCDCRSTQRNSVISADF